MLRNSIILLLVVLFGFFLPSVTFAEDTNTTPSPTTSTVRNEGLEKMRIERKEALETLAEERKEKMEDFREETKIKREEAIERYKAQRMLFEQKLETIKDERKKDIVDKIDTRMSERNEKYVSRMTEIIEKLKNILSKISEKVAVLKTEGKDTTALDSAIDEAEAAIVAAEAAVTVQAGKEYVITLGSESALRITVGSVVSSFRGDLRVLHQAITKAKQAVMKAAREVARLRGERVDEPTVTTIPSTGSATVVQ